MICNRKDMKLKLKKAGTLFINVFLLIMPTAAAMLIILKMAGIIPYVVMSGSMEPEIPVGSLCFVNTNVSYESIVKGDIIAFTADGEFCITHRVTDVGTDGFVTKGDGNSKEDLWKVRQKNYKGKTVVWIPYIGYILRIIPEFINFLLQ